MSGLGMVPAFYLLQIQSLGSPRWFLVICRTWEVVCDWLARLCGSHILCGIPVVFLLASCLWTLCQDGTWALLTMLLVEGEILLSTSGWDVFLWSLGCSYPVPLSKGCTDISRAGYHVVQTRLCMWYWLLWCHTLMGGDRYYLYVLVYTLVKITIIDQQLVIMIILLARLLWSHLSGGDNHYAHVLLLELDKVNFISWDPCYVLGNPIRHALRESIWCSDACKGRVCSGRSGDNWNCSIPLVGALIVSEMGECLLRLS